MKQLPDEKNNEPLTKSFASCQLTLTTKLTDNEITASYKVLFVTADLHLRPIKTKQTT